MVKLADFFLSKLNSLSVKKYENNYFKIGIKLDLAFLNSRSPYFRSFENNLLQHRLK